ncbi:hypothetical protein GCM10010315_04010 [Streptomyces luteosporeus]|uniref:Uncharacterized protein n=1 Tax=Streptomyces luteosporeus TaxID=173856 RepID=A0ABN3TMA2_9ACTN
MSAARGWRGEARRVEGIPYYTTHSCTGCGADVHGIYGRWACGACGACSPYSEPPEGWATEITAEELAAGVIGYDRPGSSP